MRLGVLPYINVLCAMNYSIKICASIVVALLCGLLPSCTADTVLADEGATQDHVSVCLQTSARVQRTTLQSSDNVQHVEYVQLYIFKGTGSDAECIKSLDVDWQQSTGQTALQFYKIDPNIFVYDGSTTYTLLAVGLDNKPGATAEGAGPTYNLPAAITNGTTLGQAVARLATGKTAHDMNHAELFAGTAECVPQRGNNLVIIDLYRRVAGVQAYLNDIPEGVTDIKLVLYKDQHSEVPLVAKPDAADGAYMDHGTATADGSTTLLDLPVNEGTLAGVAVTGTTLKKRVGTVLDGAYVLPVEASADQGTGTLNLKLYKGGVLYKTYRVAVDDGRTRSYNFPLRANCFYTIGTLNLQQNEPLSLGEATADITIQVEPNFEKDHDFDIQ